MNPFAEPSSRAASGPEVALARRERILVALWPPTTIHLTLGHGTIVVGGSSSGACKIQLRLAAFVCWAPQRGPAPEEAAARPAAAQVTNKSH